MIELGIGRYMGNIVGQTETAGLRLSETVHHPTAVAPAHRHRRPYFCYVLGGRFIEESERGTTDHERGSLVYHPPSAAHADRFSPAGARCLNLELVAPGPYLHRKAPDSLLLDGHRARWAAARLFETWRRGGAGDRRAVTGLASLLLEETLRHDGIVGRTPDWMTAATTILDREYRQAWSLRALAKRVGVSTSTVARGFRTRHGCTVGDYVHYRRVEEAIRLLSAGVSLSGLAAGLGFADQSHLTRIFRRHTGLSPLRYSAAVIGPSAPPPA